METRPPRRLFLSPGFNNAGVVAVAVKRADSVEAKVRADLRRWGAEIADTALAALALNGARSLDDPELSPTPRSMLIAQVRETLLQLAELAAERAEPEDDDVDELRGRRERRRERRGA